MWSWIKNTEALVIMGPFILSGLASPLVQQELDRQTTEVRSSPLVQETPSDFCDINDKPELTQGQEIAQAAQEMDLGDWAEEKKRQRERDDEIDASLAGQDKAGASPPPPPDSDSTDTNSVENSSQPDSTDTNPTENVSEPEPTDTNPVENTSQPVPDTNPAENVSQPVPDTNPAENTSQTINANPAENTSQPVPDTGPTLGNNSAVQDVSSKNSGTSDNVALADSMSIPNGHQSASENRDDLQESPMVSPDANASNSVSDTSQNSVQPSNAALADSLVPCEPKQQEPPASDGTEETNV